MTAATSITAVAELAGVSIATVSRVLNNSKPVSPEVRSRVEAAVAQLGYRANAFGRSLRKAQSGLLLIMVPDFANPYYAEIVKGIESVVCTNGYNILLADAPESWTKDSAALGSIFNGLADGVISLAHIDAEPELLKALSQRPWVACSEFVPGAGVPYVSIDHRQAGIDAVQYLINRGHRRIGLILAEESYLWAQQRREGYEMALSRAGIEIDHRLMRVVSTIDFESGAEATGSFLSLELPPTAIFAVSDTLAIGAIKALHRARRRVPEDVAVIGFDNVPLAAVFEPGLTTVAQPMRELGSAAAETLLQLLRGEKAKSRTLAHSLMVRESA